MEYEYKRRVRVTNRNYANQKQKQVNGRGGAPALMHRPAAVKAALSTERKGECSHIASQPYSAAARAPVYPEARELRWTRKGCSIPTALSLATTNHF